MKRQNKVQSRLFGKSIEKKNLSPRRDSNSRPLVYKTSALTTELQRLVEYVGSIYCYFLFAILQDYSLQLHISERVPDHHGTSLAKSAKFDYYLPVKVFRKKKKLKENLNLTSFFCTS